MAVSAAWVWGLPPAGPAAAVGVSCSLGYHSRRLCFACRRFPKTRFVGIMQYDGDLKLPARYLVSPPTIAGTSGEFLAKNGLSTFVCSETQKFGHVTFFWWVWR